MIRLESVKRLLLISFFLLSFSSFGIDEISNILNCGEYDVHGYFSENNRGDHILTLRHGSSHPFELMVIGGSITDRMDHLNRFVNAKIYVSRKITTSNRSLVFLKRYLPLKMGSKDATFIKSEKCGKKY